MFGHDAFSENPFSAVPVKAAAPKATPKADPFRKDYRKALKARAMHIIQAREAEWTSKREAQQVLRKSLVRAMHPERIEVHPQWDDEADVEFLLLNS